MGREKMFLSKTILVIKVMIQNQPGSLHLALFVPIYGSLSELGFTR